MTDYVNFFGPVEIIGNGQLTERFVRVRMDPLVAYMTVSNAEYLVFADTLRYRADGQTDPLDVRRLNVVIHEEMTGEDGEVAVTLEVKA